MTDQVPVRVSGPQFRSEYEWYERGAELDVPEEILEQYPRRLERITLDASADDANAPLDPGAYTIDELQDELANSEYSDAELAALRLAEVEGGDRTGAKDAIDDHLEG
jgi:hypothetical protein